jgi:hypothetical protein
MSGAHLPCILRVAVELRHPSWHQDSVFELLEKARRRVLGSPTIGTPHAQGVAIREKAWTVPTAAAFRNRRSASSSPTGVFCPAEQTAPIPVGATTAHFPAAVCRARAPRRLHHGHGRTPPSRFFRSKPCCNPCARCRNNRAGASPAAHDRRTPARACTALQRPKARYKGIRKNTLDVRRVGVVTNLRRLAPLPRAA